MKSNVGHGEAASGVSSIVKVLISYENECIPANLNLNKLKPIIAEMCPPLFPINENLPYSPGIKTNLINLEITLIISKFYI